MKFSKPCTRRLHCLSAHRLLQQLFPLKPIFLPRGLHCLSAHRLPQQINQAIAESRGWSLHCLSAHRLPQLFFIRPENISPVCVSIAFRRTGYRNRSEVALRRLEERRSPLPFGAPATATHDSKQPAFAAGVSIAFRRTGYRNRTLRRSLARCSSLHCLSAHRLPQPAWRGQREGLFSVSIAFRRTGYRNELRGEGNLLWAYVSIAFRRTGYRN